MSYSDLFFFLLHVHAREENKNFFTPHEWNCILRSLDNPFITALLQLYPFPKELQDILNRAIAREQARAPHRRPNPALSNVHNALMSSERAKAQQWLSGASCPFLSPVNPKEWLIPKVATLVQIYVVHAQAQQALQDQELYRLQTRLRLAKENRITLPQQQTIVTPFPQIQESFQQYLQDLETQFHSNTTYAWSTLAQAFVFISSLPLESEQKKDAEIALLLALDDSRAAYHAEAHKFDPNGSDQSCLKGFEERLFDNFWPFMPLESQQEDLVLQSVRAMTDPFVRTFQDLDSAANRRSPSPLLYQHYLLAAGYTHESRIQTRWTLKGSITDEALLPVKNQWYSTAPSGDRPPAYADLSPRQQAFQDKKFHAWLQYSLSTVTSSEALPYGLTHLCEAQESHETLLTPPPLPLSQEQILLNLSRSLKSLGDPHMELLLTITGQCTALRQGDPFAASDETLLLPAIQEMQAYAHSEMTNGQPCSAQTDLTPSFFMAYEQFLDASKFAFFPLPHVRLLSQLRIAHTLPCSETALCAFLSNEQSQSLIISNQPFCARLAVLCAKEGFSRAIAILTRSPFPIAPSYTCRQERRSLVSMAIDGGHLNVILALYHGESPDKFAFLQYTDLHGHSPLHIACRENSLPLVTQIIKAAGPRLPDLLKLFSMGGQSPFHLACQVASLSIVQAILNTEGATDPLFLFRQEQNGSLFTALHCASRGENPSVIHAILDSAGPSMWDLLSCAARSAYTSLHAACVYGNLLAAQALLSKDGSHAQNLLMMKTQNGETALYLACQKGCLDVIRFLLDFLGQNAFEALTHNACYGLSPWHGTIVNSLDPFPAIRMLIDLFPARSHDLLFHQCEEQETILHFAARNKQEHIVKYLLEQAGDRAIDLMTVQSHDGSTALHKASKNGNEAVLEHLLAHFGNRERPLLSYQDRDGNTALHIAIQNKKFSMTPIMINALGSDPLPLLSIKNKEGNTALHIACKQEDFHSVKAILHPSLGPCSPLLFLKNNIGNTPFLMAAYNNQSTVVCHLLDRAGAQALDLLLAPSARGHNFLKMACEEGNPRIVKQILQKIPHLLQSLGIQSQNILDLGEALSHSCDSNEFDQVPGKVVQYIQLLREIRENHLKSQEDRPALSSPIAAAIVFSQSQEPERSARSEHPLRPSSSKGL